MNMKIKQALGAAGLLFALAGCNLDIQMYDGVTAEDVTVRNFKELSQGSYRLLKNDGGLIDNGFYFRSLGGDDLCWGGTSTSSNFKDYDYGRKLNSEVTEYTWELGYRTIGNCNKIIEMATELGESITPEERVMTGENYYLRALSYFWLINEFAQPYSNNPTQNPGLPLKLNSDPNDLPESRSTVAEIYAQIVLDLLDAIDYMTLTDGQTPKDACYATKEAAQALLATVYLYMENWDGAYEMADAVIKSGRFELLQGESYDRYPQFIPEENSETIFAVRRTRLLDDGSYSPVREDSSSVWTIKDGRKYMLLPVTWNCWNCIWMPMAIPLTGAATSSLSVTWKTVVPTCIPSTPTSVVITRIGPLSIAICCRTRPIMCSLRWM